MHVALLRVNSRWRIETPPALINLAFGNLAHVCGSGLSPRIESKKENVICMYEICIDKNDI
jgi:hypothetical protein